MNVSALASLFRSSRFAWSLAGLKIFGIVLAPLAAAPAATLPGSPDIPTAVAGIVFERDPSRPLFGAPAGLNAPAIGAITEITLPGETVSIAGEGLEGATLHGWTDGFRFELPPLRADQQRMQAVLPETHAGKPVKPGVVLLWPQKAGQFGAPILVNAPAVWWTWPAAATPGMVEPLRLFGKNLGFTGTEPVVALLPVAGGDTRRLEVTRAGPYELQVRVPEAISHGEYRLAVHNGTGAEFGWSEQIPLNIEAPRPEPSLAIRITAGPGNAVEKQLVAAIARATRAGGAVIELPEGVFEVNETLIVPKGVPVVLRGVGTGRRAPEDFALGHHPSALRNALPGGTVIFDHRGRGAETSFIELHGDGSRLENLTIVMRSLKGRRAALLTGREQTLRNVRFVNQSGTQWDAVLVESRGGDTAMHTIEDCEFVFLATAIRLSNSHHVRVSRCAFHGMYMMGRGVEANAILNDGSAQMVLEHSTFRSVDRTRGRVLGRTVLFKPHNIRNVYVHANRSESVGSHSSVPGMEGNVSEQYLFHAYDSMSEGVTTPFVVTSATAHAVTVDFGGALESLQQRLRRRAPPSEDDAGGETSFSEFGAGEQWVVFLSRGRGAGQWRVIAGVNPDGSLRLTRPWRIIPDATSRAVVDRANRQIAIHENLIDAAPDPQQMERYHKTVGVYFFFHTYDTVTVGNTLRNLGSGIGFATRRGQPCAWNTVRENVFENITGYAGGTSFRPLFFNEHERGVPTDMPALNEWTSAGNTFRANRGRGADVAALVGWLRYDVKDDAYQPTTASGLMLTVIERNEFREVDRGILLSAPANWTLLRHNQIEIRGKTPAVEMARPSRVLDLLRID